MNNNNSETSTSLKLMAALSYISYFFLPVIFPLIVWIVASDRPFVKKHAKRAFWSQLFPVIWVLVLAIVIGLYGAFNTYSISWGWMSITLIAVTCVIVLTSLIYNVACAIRVLVY